MPPKNVELATAVLLIAPPATSDLGEVTGTLTDPGIGTLSPDEPILKFVDLSTRPHRARRRSSRRRRGRGRSSRVPRARPSSTSARPTGQRAGVLAFLPRNSDLPLQVAFPLLIANLTGELFGGSAAPTTALAPGDPVTLPMPAGATSIVVTRPDGSTVELAPATAGAASVTFSQTDLLGVYTASAVFPSPTPGPSGGATTRPRSPPPTPAASPARRSPPATLAPGASPTAPPVDPDAPVRFAVDLFDPGESDIAPGSPAHDHRARPPGSPARPGAVRQPGTRPSRRPPRPPRPRARRALPARAAPSSGPARATSCGSLIVLVVLVVLLAEWLVYHRDAVTRLWRGLRRRAPAAREPGAARRPGGAADGLPLRAADLAAAPDPGARS